jgi:dienelactone hydrolase
MKLNEYLEDILAKSHCPITFSGDIPNILCRWLVRSQHINEAMTKDTQPYLDQSGRLLLLQELTLLPIETVEVNWRLYISDMIDRFHEMNSPMKLFSIGQNKYMYCLCNVICEREEDIFLSIITFSHTALRIWINGVLLYTASPEYLIKTHYAVFRFKKGNNHVLVESTLFEKISNRGQEFIFKLNPLGRFLKANGAPKFELLDRDFFDFLKNSYSIFPEKIFYLSGEEISFVVLPHYFNDMSEEQIKVTFYNAKGDCLESIYCKTAQRVSLRIRSSEKGVLRIQAESRVDGTKSSIGYVFLGDFITEIEVLIKLAEARQDCGKGIIESILGIIEISQVLKGFKQLQDFIPGDMYNVLLEKIGKFQNYLDTSDAPDQKAHDEIFNPYFMVFENKRTSDGFTAYSVQLPEGYNTQKKYPLVLHFTGGEGRLYPIDLPWVKRSASTEAIIVNMVGIGRMNYVDDANLVRTMGSIIENHNIDRNRIYVIGYCTGAVKAFNIAFKIPDLFVGLSNVVGDVRLSVHNPEYEYLRNIDHTVVYGLVSTEDWFINSTRITNFLQRMVQSKTWMYNEFTHAEFSFLFNSKIMFKRLIQERREKYPRKLQFTVIEPGYNKSFWLKVDYINDLNSHAEIKAEIKSSHTIEIHVKNIGCFSVLASTKAMRLESEIEIIINHSKQKIQLSRYSRISITMKDLSFTAAIARLSKAEFDKAYDYFGMDENLMGIKQLYLDKCRVVKPDFKKEGRMALNRKLSFLLQFPIKERYIPYQYESCYENEFDMEHTGLSNLVFMIDARNKSDKQEKLLESTGIKLDARSMTYKGRAFFGDYFTFIKCQNPLYSEHSILIVAYNSDVLEGEIIKLMNAFDTQPLFYNDWFVYNDSNYYPYRNNTILS